MTAKVTGIGGFFFRADDPEALGLALPGNGSMLATHADREALFKQAGRRIVEITKAHYDAEQPGLLPREIASLKAFENAIAVVIALGGSTNAVLHLLAIAREAGVPFDIDEFDAISRTTPIIGDLKPAGRYMAPDMFEAGGTPLLVDKLRRAGLLSVRQEGGCELLDLAGSDAFAMPVEDDAEAARKFPLVIDLETGLRWRQKGAGGVVDEVKCQAAAGLAIAKCIEFPEALDAALVDAFAALAVDVFLEVTGQGSDDLDPVVGQEPGQILLARLAQDGEVAAIHDVHAERAGTTNEVAKVRVEFGCPAGKVQGFNLAGLEKLDHGVDGSGRHHLLAVRSGIHVAVQAALVAAVAEIDLQGLQLVATDPGKV